MFSKACKYGIRAATYIAKQSINNKRVGLKEIIKEIDSPEAFTSKILQKLKNHQLIYSEKGPHGGFYMEANQLNEVSLLQIIDVFDGSQLYKECSIGLKECNHEKPCPLHNEITIVRENLLKIVANKKIIHMAKEFDQGLAFLKS